MKNAPPGLSATGGDDTGQASRIEIRPPMSKTDDAARPVLTTRECGRHSQHGARRMATYAALATTSAGFGRAPRARRLSRGHARSARHGSGRIVAARGAGGDGHYEVPKDAFSDGVWPPEAKAAKSMKLLFTMVALRVVLAQEEGFGNECHDDPSYTETYDDLTTFLNREPLRDTGDEWLGKLLRHPKHNVRMAAVRILEVRHVYAREEFEWGVMRDEALESMDECYGRLLADHLARSAGRS